MSNIYAPYREDVEEQHRYSIRHAYSAIAHPTYGDPFELEVEECSITFDSSWAPYIQGDLTVKVIEDQELLDSLDPRNGCRISLYMGYVYDGFVDDSHLIADLHIRTRSVDRPSNTIKLSVTSDELLAEDYKRLAWGPMPPTTGINAFVKFHADRACLPTPATVISDVANIYGASELEGMKQETGQSSLDMILDAAQRLNLRVYCDGDRVWRIRRHAQYAGQSALKLFTGPSGTILDSSTVLTRGETEGKGFHNAVSLKYSWKDSNDVDKAIYGNAVVKTGPYAASAIGYNVFFEEREFAIASVALANAAAASTLQVLASRGQQALITAHAAYWIRPGHTVTVQLPAGDQQRYLVRQVQFNPVEGTMNLSLVQPIDVEISTTDG